MLEKYKYIVTYKILVTSNNILLSGVDNQIENLGVFSELADKAREVIMNTSVKPENIEPL